MRKTVITVFALLFFIGCGVEQPTAQEIQQARLQANNKIWFKQQAEKIRIKKNIQARIMANRIRIKKERQANIRAEKIRNQQIEREKIEAKRIRIQKEKKIKFLNPNFPKPQAIANYIRKPNIKIGFSKKPFASISKQTQKYVDIFLKQNPFDIPTIPQRIEKPKLPKVVSLTKGRFEKTVIFNTRVKSAMDKRDIELKEIQTAYRKKVEKRNLVISVLGSVNLKTKSFVHKGAKIFQEKATKWALQDVMKTFKLTPKDYNADTEIMLAKVESINSKYSKIVTFKIPPHQAEEIFENPENYNPVINFNIENSNISLVKIQIQNFSANLDSSFKKAEKLNIKIKNLNTDFASNQKSFQKQSANLKDYIVDRTNFVDTKYIDDLPKLLANSKQAQKDWTKWAFIIGIETYDDTQNIPFSKRSSQMFKKVVKKSLGVPERNIYTLIENGATTTKIKDRMRRMLENVKNGDTVYFYYSGHGVPSNDGKAYILPKDKMVDYVSEDKSLQLENIYLTLTNSKASKVIAFVDSCFSGKTGSKKDETLFKGKGTAGIYVKEIKTEFDKKKMAVITAGGKNDFSNMYEKKGHRMFSYFLMRDILKGEKKLDILHSSIKVEVYETSNKKGDRYSQTPEINGNSSLEL